MSHPAHSMRVLTVPIRDHQRKSWMVVLVALSINSGFGLLLPMFHGMPEERPAARMQVTTLELSEPPEVLEKIIQDETLEDELPPSEPEAPRPEELAMPTADIAMSAVAVELPALSLSTFVQDVQLPVWSGPAVDERPLQMAQPARQVFENDELEKIPKALRSPYPAYPNSARKMGLEAEIMTEFVIDKSGHVRDMAIVSRNPNTTAFDRNVLECLATWEFAPGQMAGKPVSSRARMKFTFRLDP